MAVSFELEKQICLEGFRLIAGVDEVGRGCLAGPVVAAACILDLSKPFPERLNDSKKLSVREREILEKWIKSEALSYSIAEIAPEEIDNINILQATKKAMIKALEALQRKPDFVLIDAIKLEELSKPQKPVIKGDSISASIAAASIIAKTYRDRLMKKMHEHYPEYGFVRNVGYPTKEHLEALRLYGPCPIHRKSFRPVCQQFLF
ncbi:MAG: ribonuclease HII [Pyrinomonadaceae bacterium]|nr:ribonuclease HII [Pyrinomonadaceae bacterium]MCX7640347.1 ribonuclease HII [Pyrinomonadaceae bacterium]MDW8304774.1 ribonuclease HII [Acidobacteriota bacterium]